MPQYAMAGQLVITEIKNEDSEDSGKVLNLTVRNKQYTGMIIKLNWQLNF